MELEFDTQRNLHYPFQTPLASFVLPNAIEINSVLKRVILEREANSSGVMHSNIGGWHSDSDLLNWPEVQALNFKRSVDSAIQHMIVQDSKTARFRAEIRMNAWANVSRAGNFNGVHSHPNHHWSGVYYVCPGDYQNEQHPHAGHLEFIDPRGAINAFKYPGKNQFGAWVKIPPQAGLMLIFPSWLQHSVIPFSSDTVRISIAFNARVDAFKDLSAGTQPKP